MAREILETIDPKCGCALFELPQSVPADKLQLIFPQHYLAFDYAQYYGYTFLHQLGYQRLEIRSDNVDWTALSSQTGLSVSTTGLKGVSDIDFVVEDECFEAVIAHAHETGIDHKVTMTVSSPKLDLINFDLPKAQVSIAKSSPLSVHSPTQTFNLDASHGVFRVNGKGEPQTHVPGGSQVLLRENNRGIYFLGNLEQLYLQYPHKAALCVARAMTQSLTLHNPQGKMMDLATTDKETEIVYRLLAANIANSWKVTDGSNAVARETSLATAVAVEVVRNFPSIDTRAAHLLRLAVYNTVPLLQDGIKFDIANIQIPPTLTNRAFSW